MLDYKHINNIPDTGQMSEYKRQLSANNRIIYRQKLEIIDGVDPYCIPKSEFRNDVDALPAITYIDMVNYLVLSGSPVYTTEQMRAYKGLDAHNQFTSGWVRDVAVAYPKEDITVIVGRVLHSQSILETPTKPWIIIEKNGTIHTANCDCKAGLGGTCTHMSAILFWIEAAVRIRETKTVTQTKAYWLLPSKVESMPYQPVCEIDFTSAKSKRKMLDNTIDVSTSNCAIGNQLATPTADRSVGNRLTTPSTDDIQNFFQGLQLTETKSAVLSVVQPFNDQYIPKAAQDKFPKPLTDLKREDLCQAQYDKLVQECASVEVMISEEDVNIIEKNTRGQADSKLWFRYRAGRITASKMKSVCHTNIDKPSASLIKSICYPDSVKFSSNATKWGCDHEKAARKDYSEFMSVSHENFQVEDSGLVIDPEFPHLGASPDGIVYCACCGSGVLEIKCPYCVKDKDATEHSCLKKDEQGTYFLNKKHQYYYQVQTQLFLCHKEYSDFVVWTEKGLHIERIAPDYEFWQEILNKATDFFERVILLELTGQFYSRAPLTEKTNSNQGSIGKSGEKRMPNSIDHSISSSQTVSEKSQPEESWCYCRQGEHGKMVACDNENCPIQWFHFTCIKMKQEPKGNWYCPECRKRPKSKTPKATATKRKLKSK